MKWSYYQDRYHVYFDSFRDGWMPVREADKDSFVVLGNFYAKDKNHVYQKGKILKDVDPKGFVPPDNE